VVVIVPSPVTLVDIQGHFSYYFYCRIRSEFGRIWCWTRPVRDR